jgi:TusA-related sulfurtransferase
MSTPTIDITRDVCPMTFVKVKMSLAGLAPAALLDVRLKEDALKNVVSSLKTDGHKVTSVARDGELFVLTVERKA